MMSLTATNLETRLLSDTISRSLWRCHQTAIEVMDEIDNWMVQQAVLFEDVIP